MFCREQAARFDTARADFEAIGAKVVAIGNGTPAMARDFVQQFELKLPVYTDPSRASFRAAGLKRNFGIGIATLRKAVGTLRGGFRQGRVQGDPWQQGGLLVIAADGQVLFEHVDAGAGRHVRPEEVLKALSQTACCCKTLKPLLRRFPRRRRLGAARDAVFTPLP